MKGKGKSKIPGKIPVLIIALIAVAIVVVLFWPSGGKPPISIPYPPTWFYGEDEDTWPTLPWLHTEDNRIVAENGDTVVLRGVAIEDPWRFYNYEEELRTVVFQTISEVWHANAIRVPVYPAYWETHPELFTDYYDHVIRACHKYGMYVILDWHGIGNVISGETTADGLRWGCKTDLPKTEAAWHQIAERYKDNSWVIYDLFNEPTDDSGRLTHLSWADWKSVAEDLIDIIRSHNPKALIMVSSYRHASDLRPIPSDPVDRENVIYGAHVYPVVEWGIIRSENKEEVWMLLDTYMGVATENYPVMMSEWGFDPYGAYYVDYPFLQGTKEDFGDAVMEWLQIKDMSWTGWIWSASWVPPMISGWYAENYPVNDFGQLIMDALAAPP